MIFVTLGTHYQPFTRLLKALACLTSEHALVVQHGHTPIVPLGPRVSWHAFMDYPEVQRYMGAASVVICHAGVGSIITAARSGPVPIVVARLAAYGEHVDGHQSDIVRALAARQAIVPCYDLMRLPELVASVAGKRSPPPQPSSRLCCEVGRAVG